MTSEGSVTHWIVELQQGDDQAAQGLWERYYTALVRYARSRLPRRHKRVRDEEDVALSAFESFCKGVADGNFPRLNDRDNLWRLLLVITARKVVDHIDHECRQKRGGGRVGGESVLAGPRGEESPGLDAVTDNEPTPEFALLVAEQYERLLCDLGDERARIIAQSKLEGYTNQEIADRLGCSVRTVERKLWLIRCKWSPGEQDRE